MTEPNPNAPLASTRARAAALARRAANPLVDRLRDQTTDEIRPDLAAAQAEIERLHAELVTTRTELKAEIELLWAELEARKV